MDRTLLEKRMSYPRCDDIAEALWLGAEAMVAPGILRDTPQTPHAAATERDVDPSWCVV